MICERCSRSARLRSPPSSRAPRPNWMGPWIEGRSQSPKDAEFTISRSPIAHRIAPRSVWPKTELLQPRDKARTCHVRTKHDRASLQRQGHFMWNGKVLVDLGLTREEFPRDRRRLKTMRLADLSFSDWFLQSLLVSFWSIWPIVPCLQEMALLVLHIVAYFI